MPPPNIPLPGFSPYGRYLVDTSKRKVSLARDLEVLFHDTQNYTEECGIQGPTTNHSRFDGLQWALVRGLKRCGACFLTPAEAGASPRKPASSPLVHDVRRREVKSVVKNDVAPIPAIARKEKLFPGRGI